MIIVVDMCWRLYCYCPCRCCSQDNYNIEHAENKHYHRNTTPYLVYCMFVKSLETIVYDIPIDEMHFPRSHLACI